MKFMKVVLVVLLVGWVFENYHIMGTLPNEEYYLSLIEKETLIYKCDSLSRIEHFIAFPRRKHVPFQITLRTLLQCRLQYGYFPARTHRIRVPWIKQERT